jgi:hypothetical protein
MRSLGCYPARYYNGGDYYEYDFTSDKAVTGCSRVCHGFRNSLGTNDEMSIIFYKSEQVLYCKTGSDYI